MDKSDNQITILLRRWMQGDHDAGEELFTIIQPELRKLARRCLRRERKGHSLESVDLVQDLFEKLATAKNIEYQDRNHFYAICTIKLRRILIDYARVKKMPLVPIDSLPEGVFARMSRTDLLVQINALLDELADTKPQICAVLTLVRILGFTHKEAAAQLGLTEDIVQKADHQGRKWLYERLTEPPSNAKGATGTE